MNEMKVAVYDIKEKKVIYITGLATCYKQSVITSRLEFKTNTCDVIRLDQIVDTDLYVVGKDEMKELIMAIDRKYSDTFDKLEKLVENPRRSLI